MTPTTPPNDDPALFAAVAEAWPRLPAGIQQGFAVAIIHAADKQSGAVRRTRHRVYTDTEITALRARTAACVAESPTAPNRMIAASLGISLSTYKRLHLNRTAKSCLAMSVAPLSASRGSGGERADDIGKTEDGL